MDGVILRRLHFAALIDGATEHIEDAAQRGLPNRHLNWCAGGVGSQPTPQPLGGVHCHTPHQVVAEVLLHLQNQRFGVITRDLNRLINLG